MVLVVRLLQKSAKKCVHYAPQPTRQSCLVLVQVVDFNYLLATADGFAGLLVTPDLAGFSASIQSSLPSLPARDQLHESMLLPRNALRFAYAPYTRAHASSEGGFGLRF
jgi:hypothetical protein